MACERPAERGQPLSRASLGDILQVVRREPAVGALSRTTVWRILDQDALKPWRYRVWLFPRDPACAAKAGRVLDLYAGWWEGRPLGAG
ncbi:MAG TPA: IS630 family transposase, partial [Actinomycetes bacterium]|nr:IS630 family transposase [Actinomycetes bacterium]